MCEQTCICSIFALQAEYKEQMRVRWETHRACTYSSCTDCQRAQHCAYNVHIGGFPSALYSAACSQISTAPCTGGSTLWAPQPLTPQRWNVPLMRGDLSPVPHSGICGRAPCSVLAVNPFLPNGSSQRGAGPRTATHGHAHKAHPGILEAVRRSTSSLFILSQTHAGEERKHL